MEMNMLHYRYYNCDLMDMNYVYGQCMYCIGLDPKYALICLCVMHDMYMFMPELPTEYAAHPSQIFPGCSDLFAGP